MPYTRPRKSSRSIAPHSSSGHQPRSSSWHVGAIGRVAAVGLEDERQAAVAGERVVVARDAAAGKCHLVGPRDPVAVAAGEGIGQAEGIPARRQARALDRPGLQDRPAQFVPTLEPVVHRQCELRFGQRHCGRQNLLIGCLGKPLQPPKRAARGRVASTVSLKQGLGLVLEMLEVRLRGEKTRHSSLPFRCAQGLHAWAEKKVSFRSFR